MTVANPDRHAVDQEARRAAQAAFDHPLVLEAGAGTGKTTTLVARIVAWTLGRGWQQHEEAAADGASDDAVARRVLSRVVAITFTEAATAEMSRRVAATLGEIALGKQPLGILSDGLPESDALRVRRARALLRSLDQLTVRTIHAFCRRLLAEYALEAGLHPRFGVDADESLQEAVLRQVVEEALTELAEMPECVRLAAESKGPREIAEALLELVRAGISEAALVEDPLSPARCDALRSDLAAALAAFRAAGGEKLASLTRARVVAETAQHLLELEDWLEADAAPGRAGLDALVQSAAALRLDYVRKWAKDDLPKTARPLLPDGGAAIQDAARPLAEVLVPLSTLDPSLVTAAHAVLARLYPRVEARLRSEGVETFSGLLRDARTLLEQRPEVAARVRRGIDQLLVDEFQDTDATQCEILRRIVLDAPDTERPGLFIVGDPKQSIYGWRNADLAAYEAFKDRVVEQGGRVHSLVVSYRSASPVLEQIERLVSPVMQAEPGVQPPFEALIASERGQQDTGFCDADRAPVELWVSWEQGEDEQPDPGTRAGRAARIEADAVAADLRELGEQGVAWKDVALLFRSGTDWETYFDALRRAGVPFAVEGDRSYFERREVLEAASLLRAVIDPNDQLALLAWLRSPLVGVPDAALIPLWAQRLPDRLRALHGEAGLPALRDAVEAAQAAIPEEIPGLDRVAGWQDNLLAGARALGRLRASFQEDAADVFVERLRTLLLVEASEAARYLGAYRAANLDRFFRDLLASLSRGDADPQAVIRTLREDVAERREHEEGRPREAIQDAVQILTIHKAKGLDFEHVYLLQCHKGHGSGEPDRATLEEGGLEFHLLGAHSLLWHRARRRRDAVERAERVRTWYVALTRAKRRLVVAGTWPDPSKDRTPETHAGFLPQRSGGTPDLVESMVACARDGTDRVEHSGARFVFPALRPPVRDGAPARRPRAARPALPAILAAAAPLAAERERAAARMARPLGRAVSQAAHEALQDADRAAQVRAASDGDAAVASRGAGPELERSVARVVGTVVHAALESLAPEADPASERERLAEKLSGDLPGRLPASDRKAAQERAEALLDRFFSGPLLGRLRAIADHVVARELPVLLPPPPDADDGPVGFLAGAVDLLYREPATGAYVVADYKTDRVSGASDLGALAERYRAQGAGYVRAVQEALELDEMPRFELWFLDAGEIV